MSQLNTELTAHQIRMRAEQIEDQLLGEGYYEDDMIGLMKVAINMDPLEFAALGYLLAKLDYY